MPRKRRKPQHGVENSLGPSTSPTKHNLLFRRAWGPWVTLKGPSRKGEGDYTHPYPPEGSYDTPQALPAQHSSALLSFVEDHFAEVLDVRSINLAQFKSWRWARASKVRGYYSGLNS